jgi:hypothetical protein
MGLDIYHYKFTKSESKGYIICRELSKEMVSTYGFSKYMATKEVESIFSIAAIFKSDLDLRKAQSLLVNSNSEYDYYKLICSGTLEQNINKIVNLESQLGLNAEKRELYEETIKVGDKEITYIDISYDCKLEQAVYYVEECGYQRKGMGLGFYEYYKNDSYYADEGSFRKLLTFCDPDNHMYNPKNIEENFIHNYESGRSIFLLSW